MILFRIDITDCWIVPRTTPFVSIPVSDVSLVPSPTVLMVGRHRAAPAPDRQRLANAVSTAAPPRSAQHRQFQ